MLWILTAVYGEDPSLSVCFTCEGYLTHDAHRARRVAVGIPFKRRASHKSGGVVRVLRLTLAGEPCQCANSGPSTEWLECCLCGNGEWSLRPQTPPPAFTIPMNGPRMPKSQKCKKDVRWTKARHAARSASATDQAGSIAIHTNQTPTKKPGFLAETRPPFNSSRA